MFNFPSPRDNSIHSVIWSRSFGFWFKKNHHIESYCFVQYCQFIVVCNPAQLLFVHSCQAIAVCSAHCALLQRYWCLHNWSAFAVCVTAHLTLFVLLLCFCCVFYCPAIVVNCQPAGQLLPNARTLWEHRKVMLKQEEYSNKIILVNFLLFI